MSKRLYPDGRYPFVISPEFTLLLHLFSPRLTAMLTKDEDHLDAMAIWRQITERENLLFHFEKKVISQASKKADLKNW